MTSVNRSVLGKVKNSTIITGDNNTVTNVPHVRIPRRRKNVEKLLFEAPVKPVVDRPFTWLRPDAGVIPVQPRPEVDELLRWCDSGVGRVRLVCGRGGQGKTMLGRVVVEAVRERGWVAGFVNLGGDKRGAELKSALSSRLIQGTSALLVVDYAENEPFALHDLLALMRAAPQVRLLLLARHDGNWWSDLVAMPQWSRLVDPDVLHLGSLTDELTGEQVAAVHAEAMRTFAAMLSMSVPDTADAELRFATTLDLYADALLRVLDARGSDDPISDLLAHESRHVRSLLDAEDVRLSGHDRELVLVAPCLMPARTLADAVTLLRSLPLERDLDESEFGRLARTLGRLYPDEHHRSGPVPEGSPRARLPVIHPACRRSRKTRAPTTLCWIVNDPHRPSDSRCFSTPWRGTPSPDRSSTRSATGRGH